MRLQLNLPRPHAQGPSQRRAPSAAAWVLGLVALWSAGGATCHRRPDIEQPPLPVVFEQAPQLEQVVQAVNRTDSIQRLQSNSTSIKLVDAGLPRLSANLSLERQKNFRLRGGIGLLPANAFDLGSNSEVFWMRFPQGIHQALMFARHDQYEQVMVNGPLPVNPTWLIDALGLTHIEPQLVTAGPITRADGNLELRVDQPTASGTYRRTLVVDGRAGFVREQTIHDPMGRLVATASSNDHRFYEQYGVVLPHDVQIQLTPSVAPPLAMRIEIGDYVINQFLSEDPTRFQMPTDGNHQVIDLGMQMQQMISPAHPGGVNPNGPVPGGNYPGDPPPAFPTLGAPAPVTVPPGSNTASEPQAVNATMPSSQYVPTAWRGPALRGTQVPEIGRR